MKLYGPTLLNRNVGVAEDLKNMVIAVDKLPEPSTLIEGANFQLLKSQKGYCATHIYTCVNGKWVDVIDNCGREDRKTKKCFLTVVVESAMPGSDDITGYLLISWSTPRGKPKDVGSLVSDVVVRKAGEFPVNPRDGERIVSSYKANQYKVTPYRFNDWSLDCSGGDVNFKYTVFHIYESGWWSRTDLEEK